MSMGMSRLKLIICIMFCFGVLQAPGFLTAALKQHILDLRNNYAYLFPLLLPFLLFCLLPVCVI